MLESGAVPGSACGAILAILAGYGISLLLGQAVTWGAVKGIDRRWIKPHESEDRENEAGPLVPPWVIGSAERLFFTTAIGVGLSGTVPAMIAWAGAKIAANWGAERGAGEDGEGRRQIVRADRIRSLSGTIISLLFALAGGVVLQYYGGLADLIGAVM